MSRKTLLSVAAILLAASGLAYCFQVLPTDFLPQTAGDSQYGNVGLFQASSDREDCLRECRERFGLGWGPNDPLARAYARCVQDCEQQFWQDFDRRTKDLERKE